MAKGFSWIVIIIALGIAASLLVVTIFLLQRNQQAPVTQLPQPTQKQPVFSPQSKTASPSSSSFTTTPITASTLTMTIPSQWQSQIKPVEPQGEGILITPKDNSELNQSIYIQVTPTSLASISQILQTYPNSLYKQNPAQISGSPAMKLSTSLGKAPNYTYEIVWMLEKNGQVYLIKSQYTSIQPLPTVEQTIENIVRTIQI